MKTILRCLVLSVALLGGAMSAAHAKHKLSFAYVGDPTHEAILYAMRNGIVKSDLIDIEFVTTSIPALGQAMLGQQYDIIETSGILIPPAVAQGLKVQIIESTIGRSPPGQGLGIWVNKDSPITSVDQLKGKRVATFGIGASSTTLLRYAIKQKYGFNVALQGGDLQFVELPNAAISAAIKARTVDAGMLLYLQVDNAERTGEFRPVFVGQKVLEKMWGFSPVNPVIIGFPDRIEAAPADYKEFNRMLKASIQYALDHPEVVQAIAAKAKSPDSVPYIQRWLETVLPAKSAVDPNDIKALNALWVASKSVGMLKNVPELPDAEKFVWPEALKPLD